MRRPNYSIFIKNIHKVPLNEKVFKKLIRKYYKGRCDIEINFDNRQVAWGNHFFDPEKKAHLITFSPLWCLHDQKGYHKMDFVELTGKVELTRLNDFDARARIILTLLHELKHAIQYDRDPVYYEQFEDDRHPMIENVFLKYRLSEAETEAEGWALIHFNRAFYFYETTCNADNK